MDIEHITMKSTMNTRKRIASTELEEESQEPIVEVQFNRIYYYGEIQRDGICQLCRELKQLESKMIKLKYDYQLNKCPNIYIYIQSEGGDAFVGLNAMDTIRSCKVPVVTVVDGYCASAATFLLLAGKERHMRSHAGILIHQLRTEFWGKFVELKDEMKNSEKMMEIFKKIYIENSKIPTKTLNNLLEKELCLTADECLEYGLVDKIL